MEIKIKTIQFKESELIINDKEVVGQDSQGNAIYDKIAALYNYKGQLIPVPFFYIDKNNNILKEENVDEAVIVDVNNLYIIFNHIGKLVGIYSGIYPNDKEYFAYIVQKDNDKYRIGILVSDKEMVKTKEELDPLKLTKNSSKELKGIFKENKMPKTCCFRIGIKGGSEDGLKYVVQVLDFPKYTDICFESYDVKIACDKNNFPYLRGSTIDYNTEEGFVVDNPNLRKE